MTKRFGAMVAVNRVDFTLYEHDVAGIGVSLDDMLWQRHREHGRVVNVLPNLPLVPHDSDHRIRDAEVLRRLPSGRPAADLAIFAAHCGGRAVGTQM